jgi:hypothetical protein
MIFLKNCDAQNSYSIYFAVQRNSKLLKIVLPTIACLVVLTFISLVGICKYRGRINDGLIFSKLHFILYVLLTKYYSLASKHRKYEIQKRVMAGSLSLFDDTADENIELPYVSFEDIAAATDNFSDSKKIGRGGFGKVYKVTKSFMSRVSVAHILSLRIFSRKQLLSSLNNSG